MAKADFKPKPACAPGPSRGCEQGEGDGEGGREAGTGWGDDCGKTELPPPTQGTTEPSSSYEVL